MISVRIKFQGRKVRIKGFGIRPLQMLRLGGIGLAAVKARVARGLNIDDQAMPPLKKRYAIQKNKQIGGGRQVRDLRLTGSMLNNLTVRSATENQVRIALTRQADRQKALRNQQISPWLGWSPADIQAVEAAARRIFQTEVAAYFREIKQRFRRAA